MSTAVLPFQHVGQFTHRSHARIARRVIVSQLSLFVEIGNSFILPPPRPNTRDVSADRHDTWGGMRWTPLARRRCAAVADGQVVWSWSPDAGIKSVDDCHGRRRLSSPALRREHEVSRNTIARGMPDCFGVPVVTTRVLSTYAREAAGATNTRHSLRLCFPGVTAETRLGQIVPRDC